MAAAETGAGGHSRPAATAVRTGTDAAAGTEAAPDTESAAGTKSSGDTGRRAAAGRRAARGVTARQHDPWRTAFFAVLVLAILAGAAWALLGSSLLVVRHEEVTGNKLVPAGRVLAAADIRRGTPLASVNTAAAARRVEQIAQVLTARVTRSFPDTVVITVRERTPALAVASAGRFALIDGSGVTIRWSGTKPAGMPVLRLPPAQLRGNPGVRAVVTILGRLPRKLRRQVVSVSAGAPAAVTLTLRSGVTVIWGSPGQDASKAAEVAVLLRTHARYIDVSDPAAAVTHG